jgi:hydrogenase/urease accessory protein HupE
MKAQRFVAPVVALMVAPSIAHAHVGFGEANGFMHGAGHPLTGIDHLCAMILLVSGPRKREGERSGRCRWPLSL